MALQEAKLEMAYLKMGIYGEAGSGKTFTSTKIAIGLHKYIKSTKPIAFLDTETGSDFVLPKFHAANIKLETDKTRAFKELLNTIDKIEAGDPKKKANEEKETTHDILIIDSITHFWNELLTAYQEKHNLNQITLRHWIPLKQTWRGFTERFINSKIHIILAGRSAFVWDDVEDEDGVKELKKVGTKMRTENEMAYEPSLLVEMEHLRKSSRIGGGWINRAWVNKDRFDAINGKHFDMPTFEDFLPHIENLNLNGDHKAIDTTQNSQEMFTNDKSGVAYFREHDELIEKIKAEIHIAYPNQNSEHKTKRLDLMKDFFNTRSFKEIEHMKNQKLEIGLAALEAYNSEDMQNQKKELEEKPQAEKKEKKK